MRKSGSITIFVSLIFVCVASLICGLTESARCAGAAYYLRTVANSVMDSIFAEYYRPLWDGYRLTLLPYADESYAEIKAQEYYDTYIEKSSVYRFSDGYVQTMKLDPITAEGGAWLEQEIVDYMTYGIVGLDDDNIDIQELWQEINEADKMQDIMDEYSDHATQAAKVEKALSKIADNLSEQEKLYSEARSKLSSHINGAFQKKAKQLENKIKDLDKLTKDYIDKADNLDKELDKTQKKCEENMGSLGDEARSLIEDSITNYRSYSDEDGKRRLQVEEVNHKSQDSLSVIASARQLADDAQDAEDSEDDDGDDARELWNEALDEWDSFSIATLGCSYGIADEEKETFIEKAKDIIKNGLIEVVLPDDRTVSEGDMSDELIAFPSNAAITTRYVDEASLLDIFLIEQYIGEFFTNFVDNKDSDIQYEIEYIIAGKATDKANLESASTRVLAIREGLNFLHIMRSPDMRSAADKLAMIIMGAVGLPALYWVMSCLIITTWALCESVNDLKILLRGGKVPLVKNDDDWKIDLDGVLEIGQNGTSGNDDGTEGRGLDYETYLKLLIFTQSSESRNYRMMDIMQHNLMKQEPAFAMEDCTYGIKMNFTATSSHLYTILGISNQYFPTLSPTYELSAEASKAY